MAITSTNTVRIGNVTQITVTSGLTDPTYYWYVDGTFQEATVEPTWSLFVESTEQRYVEVIDSTDPDFDPVADGPDTPPPRRTLFFVTPVGEEVDYFLVEQDDGGGYETVERVYAEANGWAYNVTTDRLADLTAHSWRITPVDRQGNAGTQIILGPETIVRRPDAPRFTLSYDEGTDRVTFAAA